MITNKDKLNKIRYKRINNIKVTLVGGIQKVETAESKKRFDIFKEIFLLLFSVVFWTFVFYVFTKISK